MKQKILKHQNQQFIEIGHKTLDIQKIESVDSDCSVPKLSVESPDCCVPNL